MRQYTVSYIAMGDTRIALGPEAFDDFAVEVTKPLENNKRTNLLDSKALFPNGRPKLEQDG